MDAASLAAKYQIQLPAELMLFFKSIVTVEGMGREIVEDFDILTQTLEIASEIIKAKYDPQRVIKDLAVIFKDSASLLQDLPKQLQNNFRKKNLKPQQVTISEFKDLQNSLDNFGLLVFLGIVIASLIISGVSFLDKPTEHVVSGMPLTSVICFITAAFLGLIAFYNSTRK
jgi:ubiquinone biosynthesis protein